MRKRLVLVYSMVALIVVILAFVLASLTVQDRVINYFQTMQTDNLSSYTQLLEDYYAKEQSWQGVERVFSNLFEGFDPIDLDYLNPYGLLLIDLNEKVLFSSNNAEIGENAPEDFKQFATHLEYNGKTVAYLVSKRFL